MVTNEAMRLLAADSRRLSKGVEDGRIGPEKIGRFVLFRVAHYVVKAAPDHTTKILVQRAVSGRAGAVTTHSELLGFKLSNLLTTTIGKLDPEEQRGILFYVTGDTRQYGLAVLGLQLLSESSAVEVTTKLVGWRSQYLQGLEERDLEVRRKVDALPLGIRRLCLSSIDEAALCLSVGDQRSAMSWLDQVRKLVARFGKDLPPAPSSPPPSERQLPVRRIP